MPVTVIARTRPSLDRLSRRGAGTPGLRPSDDAPVWRMDAFRDEFLAAYGPEGHTGTARAVTR